MSLKQAKLFIRRTIKDKPFKTHIMAAEDMADRLRLIIGGDRGERHLSRKKYGMTLEHMTELLMLQEAAQAIRIDTGRKRQR